MEKININPNSPPELIFEQMLANNKLYQQSTANSSDISATRRTETARDGQAPYAAVLTCADSRVAPEHIFMAGVGELFSVRSAGNTVGAEALGSIEYAVGHLGVRLIIVMGHSHCGAVVAAMNQNQPTGDSALSQLIAHIHNNIASADDETAAVRLNIENEISNLSKSPELAADQSSGRILIRGVIYDIASGEIEPVS
ncbi:MAG: carbonic anhydrase [Candidatus Nomurabacteria bacterium]|jgi:carbonic anhydrase|nr:carbonic anhydrase [Candidatus Nomurabacteria bacterium]